ncbi:MAG: DUF3883 domain-containing protein [Verrucomicrobiota bacterium]|jgi:hypothetical protein
MNGSSNKCAAVLAAITPQQILTLMEILQGTAWRSHSFVAALYKERARNFDETLTFLEELGWVVRSSGDLQAAPEPISRLCRARPGETPRALAEALTDSPGPHRQILREYLGRFGPRDGEVVYRPLGEHRLEESSVRNFLMELGAVLYRPDADQYVVSKGFEPLYLWAKNVRGRTDNATLAEQEEGRHRLGRAAELAVVAFEKKRLGSPWAAEVQHISATLPAACYDIKSLTVEGAFASPRFIEVKAVPADSFQFYWTASEVEAACLLGASYFLYLVPVIGQAAFDLNSLEIVENPYVNVYQNPTVWSRDESVIVCRRRSKTATT